MDTINKNLGGYKGTGQFGAFDGVQYNAPTALSPYGSTSAIPVDKLSSNPVLALPEKPMSDTVTEPTLPEITTDLQKEQQRLAQEKTAAEGGLSTLMKQMGIEQSKEAGYATEAGADLAQQEYDRYASELQAEQLNTRRQIEELQRNTVGGLQGAIATRANEINRKSLATQADIAILGNAAKGRFDTALAIAQRKVDSALAPIKAELEAKKFIYDNNKDLYTKAQLSKLDGFIKADERKIAKEEQELTTANNYVVNALQSKAPQSLITKAQEAINSGKSSLEVAKILGDYTLSPTDRLNNKLKEQELNKVVATVASGGTTGDKVLDQEVARLPGLEEQVKQIDSIKKRASFTGAIGPTKIFGRLGEPGDIFGNKQNLVADTEKILTQLTLNKLIESKGQGATFGALSEGELKILEAAASKLTQVRQKDKNGNVTGYKITEKAFNEEMDRLKSNIQDTIKSTADKVGTTANASISNLSNDDLLNLPTQNISNKDFFNK